MGIMKKLATVALSAVMLASMSVPLQAATPASGDCGRSGSSVHWSLDASGLLTISGSGKMLNYTSSLDVPWYKQRNDIKEVVVESGVEAIGEKAFYQCTNLGKVTIASSVKTIGGNAFSYCKNLGSVKLPSKLKVISSDLFEGCSYLESVTVPVTVKEIQTSAFYGCDNLVIKYKGSSVGWKEIKGYDLTSVKSVSKKYSLKPLKTPTLKSAAKASRSRYVRGRKIEVKKATVKWKKKSGITGYQIRYYVKSSGSHYVEKIVKVKSKSTVKKVIKFKYGWLDYKVQIRTYKKISGGYNYSKWSKAKTVKY